MAQQATPKMKGYFQKASPSFLKKDPGRFSHSCLFVAPTQKIINSYTLWNKA